MDGQCRDSSSTPTLGLAIQIQFLTELNAKYNWVVVVVDLPLLRVAVEGSDKRISLEKPCQASLPPDQQGHHSLGRHPEVQYIT